MATPTLLTEVKTALRLTGASLDSEINALIKACLVDLKIAGLDVSECLSQVTDPLIRRAVILYAKADFNIDGDGERYTDLYENTKGRLVLAVSRYGEDAQ